MVTPLVQSTLVSSITIVFCSLLSTPTLAQEQQVDAGAALSAAVTKTEEGDLVAALEQLQVAATDTSRSAQVQEAAMQLAMTASQSARWAVSADAWAVFVKMVEQEPGAEPQEDLATACHFWGQALSSDNQFERAVEALDRSIRIREEIEPSAPSMALAWSLGERARCHAKLDAIDLALHDVERSREIAAASSTEPSSLLVNVQNTAGETLLILGEYPSAASAFSDSLDNALALIGDAPHPAVVNLRNNLAMARRSSGDLDGAIDQLRSSLDERWVLYGEEAHPEVMLGLTNLAQALAARGDLEEALLLQQRCEAMYGELDWYWSDLRLAKLLSVTATIHERMGRLEAARELYVETLRLRGRWANGEPRSELTYSLNNIAHVDLALGQPARALPLLRRSLEIRQGIYGDRPHPSVVIAFGNLGRCLFHLGQDQEALEAFERALFVRKQLDGETPRVESAEALTNLSTVHARLGNLDESIRLATEALRIADQFREQIPDREYAMKLMNLASPLQETGDFERAGEIKQQIVDLHRSFAGGRPEPVLARALIALASNKICQNDFEAAKGLVSEALGMFREVLGDGDHVDIAIGERILAETLEGMGQEEAALDLYLGSTAMMDRVWSSDGQLTSEDRQQWFDELKRGNDIVAIQRLAFRLDRPRVAFDAAEGSRARVFLARLEQVRSEVPGAVSEPPSAELAAMRSDYSRTLASRFGPDADPALDLADWRSQVDRIRRQLDDLENSASRNTAMPGVEGSRRSIEEIAGCLRPHELILTYFVWDNKVCIYCLEPSGEITAALENLPEGGIPRLVPGGAAAGERGLGGQLVGRPALDGAGSALSKALLPEKILARVRGAQRLFVSPHGALHQLPFGALPVQSAEGAERPLIEVGPPISYILSGSSLVQLRGRQGNAVSPHTLEFLAIADPEARPRSATAPRVGGARTWPPLKGARAEALSIARLVEEHTGLPDSTAVLIGQSATEPAVRELVAKARYLHFATHGIAEETANRSLSMLLLSAPAEVTGDDDGFLGLSELYSGWGGDLSGCEMVVLAACSTLVGHQYRDDAPTAIPFGFLQSGANSVVATLWPVSDEVTREFMVDFYSRLLDEETDRLTAFHAARRALASRHPAPESWAPFVFLGLPE